MLANIERLCYLLVFAHVNLSLMRFIYMFIFTKLFQKFVEIQTKEGVVQLLREHKYVLVQDIF